MAVSRKNPKRGRVSPVSRASRQRQQAKNYIKRDARIAEETKAIESTIMNSLLV